MHNETFQLLTSAVGWQGYLPLLIILIPLLGAAAVFLISRKKDKCNSGESCHGNPIFIVSSVLTLLAALLMYGPVVNGVTVNGHAYKGISDSISYLPAAGSIPFFNLTFKIDPAGLLILIISAFIYMIAAIYAAGYMKIEESHATRYTICSLITMAANMGVIAAGDLFTLFIFFEGLVIFPYFMFAHREEKDSLRGANIYLYLGVASGLALLGGIFLLYHFTGSVDIKPMGELINKNVPSFFKCLISALMIIGFGGKAGIFLEHFWMPKAYPFSPTPTPVMSSGAMIKAGAYGIFRVVNMIFIPAHLATSADWATASNIGYIVIFIGVATMFFGVLGALISSNSNRMLAYHSVSQMGYIVMGIGVAGYLGADGAMGLAGALYHIVNHSLFKVALFLGVGAVYFRTKEADMYKLGGLWKNMPVAALGLFVAVCGISGIPLFNGFASKTLLHHAINEAYEHSIQAGHPDRWLRYAEIIFIVTAAGTFASNMKLFILTFMMKRPEKYKDVEPSPMPMNLAISLLTVLIIFIGLFPNLLLEYLIGPSLAYFGFNPASHPYHMLYDIHSHTSTITILYGTEGFAALVHNLLGSADAILIGGVMFLVGLKFGWFHFEVPQSLTVEYHYRKFFRGFKTFCTEPVSLIADLVDELVSTAMVYIWLPVSHIKSIYKKFDDKAIETIGGEPVVDKYLAKQYMSVCDLAGELDLTVVDGTIVESGRSVTTFSGVLRKIQTGYLQNYLMFITIGLFAMVTILYFIVK